MVRHRAAFDHGIEIYTNQQIRVREFRSFLSPILQHR